MVPLGGPLLGLEPLSLGPDKDYVPLPFSRDETETLRNES